MVRICWNEVNFIEVFTQSSVLWTRLVVGSFLLYFRQKVRIGGISVIFIILCKFAEFRSQPVVELRHRLRIEVESFKFTEFKTSLGSGFPFGLGLRGDILPGCYGSIQSANGLNNSGSVTEFIDILLISGKFRNTVSILSHLRQSQVRMVLIGGKITTVQRVKLSQLSFFFIRSGIIGTFLGRTDFP